jgi:hypothetical protein
MVLIFNEEISNSKEISNSTIETSEFLIVQKNILVQIGKNIYPILERYRIVTKAEPNYILAKSENIDEIMEDLSIIKTLNWKNLQNFSFKQYLIELNVYIFFPRYKFFSHTDFILIKSYNKIFRGTTGTQIYFDYTDKTEILKKLNETITKKKY